MGKSLKDLFEISEEMDPKQEAIASILGHTIDADTRPQGLTPEEVERNEALSKLAQDLETGTDGVTVNTAKDRLRDILGSDTDPLQAKEMDEDVETYITPKSSSDKADMKKKIKADTSKSSTEKEAIAQAIDDAKPGDEVVAETIDDEGRMAKSELLKLTQYSAKLYKALGDSDQLPAWIQSKITLAADYIGTVKHYLEGEQVMGGEEAPQGQLEEAKGDVEHYNWEDLHLDIFINKPVEEISDQIYLPLGSDGRIQFNTGNYKRVLELPDGYVNDKLGKTKEDLVKQELGYLERDFYNWKDRFDGAIEGDEEVKVVCGETDCTVHVDTIKKMSDKYSAGKAKGDTKDVYESSLVKILSK